MRSSSQQGPARAGSALLSVLVALTAMAAAIPSHASAPGDLALKLNARYPLFPCGSCTATISGTAIGAVHGAANFTTASSSLTGSLSYFESGCPPTAGTGNGTLTIPMKDGSKVATLVLSFHYQRTGAVMTLTGTGSVADKNGAHRSTFTATGRALFVAEYKKTQVLPPCTPAPLPVVILGDLVTR